jgi:hypothetical protein
MFYASGESKEIESHCRVCCNAMARGLETSNRSTSLSLQETGMHQSTRKFIFYLLSKMEEIDMLYFDP